MSDIDELRAEVEELRYALSSLAVVVATRPVNLSMVLTSEAMVAALEAEGKEATEEDLAEIVSALRDDDNGKKH